MAKTAKSKSQKWYDQHYWSLVLALAFFVIAYLIGSRGVSTGSWQQYGLTLLFVILAVNRLVHASQTTAQTLWAMLPKRKD